MVGPPGPSGEKGSPGESGAKVFSLTFQMHLKLCQLNFNISIYTN